MGMPKICVSLTPINENEFHKQVKEIISCGNAVDLIEWRIDYWQEEIQTGMKLIHNLVKPLNKSLIFTFRTKSEGGMKLIIKEAYEDLCLSAANTHDFDYVDVELKMLRKERSLIDLLHQAEVKTIVSHHNFDETPSNDAMIQILKEEEAAGGDIVKLAIMPNVKEDVARVVETGLAFHYSSDTPMIIIAMGELGKPTRVMGDTIGSCITFGSIKTASAPGQIPAKHLKRIMKALHYE